MKIVHVAGWYHPDSLGGTEGYVAGLSERLRRLGHEVWVAAPRQGGLQLDTYEHAGIPVYRYPTPLSPTRDECQGRVAVRGTDRFHEWLADVCPDIVHFHSFTTGVGLPELLAARSAGARVVATNHLGLGFICKRVTLMQWGEHLCDARAEPIKCAACELQKRMPKAAASLLARIGDRAGEAARQIPGSVGTALSMPALIRYNQSLQGDMLSTVDRFVLLNARALRAFIENGAPPEKLQLNRLGVSHVPTPKPDVARKPTTRPVTVGYLGRLVAIKGVLDLARAFMSLPHDAALFLEFRGPVHDSETREVVAKLKAIVGSDPRVRFADPVPPEDAGSVLAGYDVLCCPSSGFENGPTVALEAQAAGTPVVGTRIGAMPEFIRDGIDGRLFAPGDWRQLAAILSDIAADPAIVDRWRSALLPVRTMDDVAADYVALYNSLVSDDTRSECTVPAPANEGASEAHRPPRLLPGDPLLVPGSRPGPASATGAL